MSNETIPPPIDEEEAPTPEAVPVYGSELPLPQAPEEVESCPSFLANIQPDFWDGF